MKPLIIANWKANPRTPEEARDLYAASVQIAREHPGVSIAACVPFPFIGVLEQDELVPIGGQDCFWKGEGAFTGEVTPGMLAALGCRGVLLGHSDRVLLARETDEEVAQKIGAALAEGLTPVVAIGEQRRGSEDLVFEQANRRLRGRTAAEMEKIVLVYEPVWAISTSPGAEAANAEDIRRGVRIIQDAAPAAPMGVLYGGSVDASNIGSVMEQEGVGGVLVGSASLDPSRLAALAAAVR